jgi:5-dehydro-2-deoxygluconokinase
LTSKGTPVVLDIDFRPDQWHDPRAFGVTVRSVLRLVDIVLGTEDEINAVMLSEASQVLLTHSQVSDARVSGDVDTAIQALLALGPRVLVHKRGAQGSRVYLAQPGDGLERESAPGFQVRCTTFSERATPLPGILPDTLTSRTGTSGPVGQCLQRDYCHQHGCANFIPTLRVRSSFNNRAISPAINSARDSQ